jgi:hypothetical protein
MQGDSSVISTQVDVATTNTALPLCVDLDGTLISSDLLLESLLQLLRSKPWYLLLLPLWVMSGRAGFKAAVAARTQLQPAALPYNKDLIAWLEQERRLGRSLWLCTAANEVVAMLIARHLGMFEGVLASNHHLNLSGKNKAAQLEQRFGFRGFDYCGNEQLDLQVWRRARGAILVGPACRLEQEAAKCSEVVQRFPPAVSPYTAAWHALKVSRWPKNALVLLPLLMVNVPEWRSAASSAVLAAISFCLCASSCYVLDDLLDLHADRVNSATAAVGPFAAGDLSLLTGVAMALALLMTSMTIAWFLPLGATLTLMAYFVLAVGNSWLLQTGSLLRGAALAVLTSLRLVMGATAIGLLL